MSLFALYARLSYFLKDFWVYLFLIVGSFVAFLFITHKVFRSSASEIVKRLVIVGSFTFFLFILVFSGFEVYFRYVFDESDSLGFLRVNNKWMDRHVVFNTYGFRDRDFITEKKPGVTRIGVIGDSMTFGYGIENPEDRFSNILEKKLNKAGKNVEVYNLGKSGYDTWNEKEEFKRVQQLKFDIIVWQYYLNDAQAPLSAGTRVLLKERAQGVFARFLSDNSYFFDYIFWRLAARYEKTFLELRQADIEAYRDARNFQHHKRDVGDFATLLKTNSGKVVVIVFPFFKFLPGNPLAREYPQIKKMFSDNTLPVIDMYESLKDKKAEDVMVSKYDYHPNESVQIIVSDRLYDTIAPMIPKTKE